MAFCLMSSSCFAGTKEIQKLGFIGLLSWIGSSFNKAALRDHAEIKQAVSSHSWINLHHYKTGFDSVTVYESPSLRLIVRNGFLVESVTAQEP